MKEEIIIAHAHLETRLVLSDEFVQVLIVENANEFFNMVCDMESCIEGREGDFAFTIGEELISPDKYGSIICDPFHFELNDKKILNLLYKRLEGTAYGDMSVTYNELVCKNVNFFEELSFSVPFKLAYDIPKPLDYMKASGLKFEKTYDSLEEKIICYINALIELKNCEFFVFVNLKSVLDDEKLLNFYKHCSNEKVGLLLIECSEIRPLLKQEKAVIITEDLCEILENYD